MFNRYPESPKVLMIYITLFKCFWVNKNYKECYRVIKRLCRNYHNSPLFWSAFAMSCSKKAAQEEVMENTGNWHKVFSYRGYVNRITQKYFKSKSTGLNEECSPLLYILQGNNYLQSLSYEKAIEVYQKALKLLPSKTENPSLFFLISKAYLQWWTSRTNFHKDATMLQSFKYLKVYFEFIRFRCMIWLRKGFRRKWKIVNSVRKNIF